MTRTIIKLEDLNRTEYKEYWVNNRKRLATATGCVFIDENHLVVTSLVGMKMYLFEIDFANSSYSVIQELDTIYDSKPTITDLLDYNGTDMLITSNCDNGTQTIYKIKDNHISFYKQITNTESLNGFCHGIKFHPFYNNLVCATIFRGCSIKYINIESESPHQINYQINYDIGFRPKDLTFVDKDRIIVLYTNSKARTKEVQDLFIAKLILYEVNLVEKSHKPISEYTINNSHGDSILFHKGYVIVNNQIQDEINILKLDNDIFIEQDVLKGYNFPHGLAYEPKSNLLAVTNYLDNTISISKLNLHLGEPCIKN